MAKSSTRRSKTAKKSSTKKSPRKKSTRKKKSTTTRKRKSKTTRKTAKKKVTRKKATAKKSPTKKPSRYEAILAGVDATLASLDTYTHLVNNPLRQAAYRETRFMLTKHKAHLEQAIAKKKG